MKIEDCILRYYLRNVYFITGTAYAGKSTAVRMLAENYNMVECGENYHFAMPQEALSRETQPNACYFQTMSGWEEFVSRSPEQYAAWIDGTSREIAEIEIAELIYRSASGKKLIADTNISLEALRSITDYDHVAVMLSPQSMSVERFFDRPDSDKAFIKKKIMECPDPERTMKNFLECVALVNSPERYAEYANSGFFTIVREDDGHDTRGEVMHALARHFKLE